MGKDDLDGVNLYRGVLGHYGYNRDLKGGRKMLNIALREGDYFMIGDNVKVNLQAKGCRRRR